MSEQQVTVRMDLSSWNQILDDLGNFWGFNPEESEVFQSVEVLGYDEEATTGFSSPPQ